MMTNIFIIYKMLMVSAIILNWYENNLLIALVIEFYSTLCYTVDAKPYQ